MTISLAAALATAQDSKTRKPIVSIASSQFQDDIPFDGEYFDSTATYEEHPYVDRLTTGQLAQAYVYDSRYLRYQVTDTDGVQWSSSVQLVDAGTTISHVSLTKMANGLVGIAYTVGQVLYSMVVNAAGAVQSGPSVVETFSGETLVAKVDAHTMQDDTYMMVYERTVSGEKGFATRTSSNFTAWSSESAFAFSGDLVDVQAKSNPVLLDTVTGGTLLFFDYVDSVSPAGDGTSITNIYYSESADGGATWGTPAAITSVSVFGEKAEHPSAAEKSDNSIVLSYTYENVVLHADDTTSGWLTSGANATSYGVSDLHYDSSSGKLFCIQANDSPGFKTMNSIVAIDVDAWSVDKSYTNATSPAWDAIFLSEHVWYNRHHGEGQFVPYGVVNTTGHLVCGIVDHANENIIEFCWRDLPEYGFSKNVEADFRGTESAATCGGTWYDSATGRLYVLFYRGYVYESYVLLGYIDVAAGIDGASGLYPWYEVLYDNTVTERDMINFDTYFIDSSADLFGWCSNHLAGLAQFGWTGTCKIYQLSTGTELKKYNVEETTGFHTLGMKGIFYHDGHVYGGMSYLATHGQQDRRGMIDININTDEIQYHRPTYATVDEYDLRGKVATDDGRLLIVAGGWGVAQFTIADTTWSLTNNGNLAGMTPDGNNTFRSIDYDAVTNTVFVGVGLVWPTINQWQGVLAYDEDGKYQRPKYRTATYDGSWTFGSEDNLVFKNYDYDMQITVDGDDSVWGVWTRSDDGELSSKWDKEGKTKSDVADYLVSGQPVSVRWTVDNLAELTFTVAQGHRFDPNNQLSAWRHVFRIGRKLALKFGETVSGTALWQNQGTYVVKRTQMKYRRGVYPELEITAEDTRSMWEHRNVVASEHYDDDTPLYILNDLVSTWGGLSAGQISLPGSISNSHTVEHQVIDLDLMSAIEDVADHWGYFPRMTMDDEFTVTQFRFTGTPDHDYATDAMLIEFTPNGEYSTMVNRVCVRGESRDFFEIAYEEELLQTINGTVGWWGHKKEIQIWYDRDKQLQVRDPRLNVIESVGEFEIFFIGGGGTEFLDSAQEDPEEFYCMLVIESPDMVELFIVTVAALIATSAAALTCTLSCGYYIFAQGLTMEILAYLLGAVANYQYELYGRPIGKEKQQLQYCANDADFQREIGGYVVVEDIDDPFAYTVATARVVADNELKVARAQRNRVQFTKVGHLQDEIGDIIRIPHPFTKVAMDVFITNINRVLIPATKNQNDGSFLDHIEGWRIDVL